MPALHTPPTAGALANVNVKAADDRSLHGELFLILRRDARRAHRAVTVRTRGGQRGRVRLVDLGRLRAMRGAAIVCTRFAPGPAWLRDTRAARKRGRLPIDRATRRLQVLFQLLVFTPQALALGFRPPQVLAQALDFSCLLVDDVLRIARRSVGRLLSDADVIAHRSATYQYKELMTTI